MTRPRDWTDLCAAVRRLTQAQVYALAVSGDRVLLGWDLDERDDEGDEQDRWNLHDPLGIAATVWIEGGVARWTIEGKRLPVDNLPDSRGSCDAEHAPALRAGIVAVLVGAGMVDCSGRGGLYRWRR